MALEVMERAGVFSCGCRYRYRADEGPSPEHGCPIHVGSHMLGAWEGTPECPDDMVPPLPVGALDSAPIERPVVPWREASEQRLIRERAERDA